MDVLQIISAHRMGYPIVERENLDAGEALADDDGQRRAIVFKAVRTIFITKAHFVIVAIGVRIGDARGVKDARGIRVAGRRQIFVFDPVAVQINGRVKSPAIRAIESRQRTGWRSGMDDGAPAVPRSAKLSEHMTRPVPFRPFPSVGTELPEALEGTLVLATPVAFRVGQRHQFLTLEDEDIGGGVGRKSLVGLALDAGDLQRPAKAHEGISQARIVSQPQLGLKSGPAWRQGDANAVAGGPGVQLGFEGFTESFNGTGAGRQGDDGRFNAGFVWDGGR